MSALPPATDIKIACSLSVWGDNGSRRLVRLSRQAAGAVSTGKPSFADCLIKADRAQYDGQNSHERPTWGQTRRYGV